MCVCACVSGSMGVYVHKRVHACMYIRGVTRLVSVCGCVCVCVEQDVLRGAWGKQEI